MTTDREGNLFKQGKKIGGISPATVRAKNLVLQNPANYQNTVDLAVKAGELPQGTTVKPGGVTIGPDGKKSGHVSRHYKSGKPAASTKTLPAGNAGQAEIARQAAAARAQGKIL